MSDEVAEPKPEPTLREKLRAPLPEGAIKQHPTKSYMSSVNSMYVIERLNDVFGEGGWDAEYKVIEANPNQPMVVVECQLRCWFSPERSGTKLADITRQTFGGNDNKDRGDAYKGACTDALTKAASQIGIAQDVYKGMYDKELIGDNKDSKGKGKNKKSTREEFGAIDGIVNNYQLMSPNTLWIKVGETPCRAVDAHIIKQLTNCLGKRVELRCKWDLTKNKHTVMTIINILGIYEPVPSTPHYEAVYSQCAKHGRFEGDGNCPECEKDVPF